MPAPPHTAMARPPMNNAKHDMIRRTEKNNGPGGASNTVTLGLTPTKEGLMSKHTRATEQISLIRSLAGHAQGREQHVLDQIRAVLDGATLDELAAKAGGDD